MDALVESTAGIALEQLTTVEALDALHHEWAALWGRCPSATPFQSPDWLIPLWRHLGEGELWTMALRHSGRLIGVAPVFIYIEPQSRTRRVLLLGTPITDYTDLLVEPPFERAAADLLLVYLAANAERWDYLDFQQLRPDSPLLKAEPPQGLTSQVMVQEICPALELHSEGHDLAAVVPARMMANLVYYRRRLQKHGPSALECARLDNFNELFETFLRLHGARWQKRGQVGLLSDERLREFHRESAKRMLLAGVLRLQALRSNGRIIAAIYGFAHRRHSYFYLSGFDPAFHSLSPGTLMLGYAIEQALAEGCTTFDFLRGREPYKFMWGAKGRLNYRRQFSVTRD